MTAPLEIQGISKRLTYGYAVVAEKVPHGLSGGWPRSLFIVNAQFLLILELSPECLAPVPAFHLL